MIHRRRFLAQSLLTAGLAARAVHAGPGIFDVPSDPDEDLFAWLQRTRGQFDRTLYLQILGAANEFKEGDAIVGVAAADDPARDRARQLLAATRIGQIDAHPPHSDNLLSLITGSLSVDAKHCLENLRLGELKTFLLERSEDEIRAIRDGLSSDVIACVVRLMSNAELIRLGAKIFNCLPGTNIGARGYLGARVQPNSPTDNLDDIRWQVFDAFAYAVGDVLLGTNPVSSNPESVAAIERALQEILVAFGIADVMPHCVLAHIDVQAEVERLVPGATAFWFQSIAGSDTANATFDISVDKMLRHAEARTGKFGLYFETGQGADFTNGHGHGMDMVLHESRKYGFARALTKTVASALQQNGGSATPWIHLNDVAGFIGPEVFRSREQLVRCCLEDIVMGKLHGLTIGLDICSTLHMDVTLDDLGWCIDQIMPANPAYLMALPTRIDPMLGYLTTSYHDHVHIREHFGFRVNDEMWKFYQSLGVIDAAGNPTTHFGNPAWVYLQYCRRKRDARTDNEILGEAAARMSEVRARGLFLAEGYGDRPSTAEPALAREVRRIYDDAKVSIWKELDDEFVATLPDVVRLRTQSLDRKDYILHPVSGEHLCDDSRVAVNALKSERDDSSNVQIVVSDGLNAFAVLDGDQLLTLVRRLRSELDNAGFRTARNLLLLDAGRVRAGYRIGELLFGGRPGRHTLLHIIGERPGSGHRTLSIYMTTAEGTTWAASGTVDHNITRVISGIATTALLPDLAAIEAIRILSQMQA